MFPSVHADQTWEQTVMRDVRLLHFVLDDHETLAAGVEQKGAK